MVYGIIQNLITEQYGLDNKVLIESPFMETTRRGKRLHDVQIALTSNILIIANCKFEEESTSGSEKNPDDKTKLELRSLHPLELIKLSIFKQSSRQVVKACLINNNVRYFELGSKKKRKIFWKMWCIYIAQLNSGSNIWPHYCYSVSHQRCSDSWNYLQTTEEEKQLKWTEKYLYLGSQREAEDKIRPMPIPGIGSLKDLKLLLCLKPRYFGCWDQSEHWVQCETYTPTETCN